MKESLSKQEWILMEALWDNGEMFLSEIMEATKAVLDWNKSSYSTYLKRMTDNGFITYQTVSGNRRYSPVLNREDCVETESSQLMTKMSDDSRRLLLVSMIEKCDLSDADKRELQELIERLKKGAD